MNADVVFALENAQWPAFLLDGSSTVRRANSAAIQTFGAVMEENFTRLEAVWSPENEQRAEMFLAKLAQTTGQNFPLKFRTKGGTTATYSTFISPVNLNGQKYHLFQFLPVSAPVAANPEPKAEPADSARAHKQKLDCALQLTRTVALDFNNALTSILGHTSLILSKLPPDSPWRNSLLEVEKSAEKAAEITHDLATFSRQDKDSRSQTAGNLNDLLRRTVDLFKNNQKANIEWKLHFEPRLYSVHFDEAKMQQAFLKVLENAVQAMPDGGRITLLTRNRDVVEPVQEGTVSLLVGRYVCVEISDNGTGIAPEVLPRIFEPFFTTKTGHRGLGLAWTYGIVTNHGGSLTVNSEPGTGTTARFYLTGQKRRVEDKTGFIDDLRGTNTILMVDDEDLLLTMGEMVLSSYGYRVLTANSAQKALDIISRDSHQISLVITDMVMPNMGGRELIEHLKVLAPEIRILCTSGYLRSNSEVDDERYLQKPFTSQSLLRKVKQVLN
jgi:two-component system cell cycle sensor histidine kinase/response regulator CckA